jgi:AcrR family transcriptional regulator
MVEAALDTIAPRGRRERNKLEKRARLIQAARRLFAAKGFDAATMQEIASAADLGAGTVYLYAPSKDDLLVTVSCEDLHAAFERAAAAAGPPSAIAAPLLDRIARFLDVLIDYHHDDVALARAFMRLLAVIPGPQSRREVQRINQDLHRRLRALVEAAPEIRRDAPIDILVGNLVSIYRMQLQHWLNEFLTVEQFRARLRASLDLQLAACREAKATR